MKILDENGLEYLWQKIKEQKVLWSGASYLNATQYADLEEPISSQKNGIVLCWSGYKDNKVQNYDWHYTFIPKWAIVNESYGTFEVLGGSNGIAGYKYFYIEDSKIKGHANNTGNRSSNGVSYTNSAYVLRAVLGV